MNKALYYMIKKILTVGVVLASILGMGNIASANSEDLTVNVLQQGDGAVATRYSNVAVHYTGWLLDGTKFDSSVDRGQPFEFILGARSVIQGWDIGVEGMKIGEKRELIIPSHLAYGDRGAGALIKPGATLKFEVELLEVTPGPITLVSPETLQEKLSNDAQAIDIRRDDERQSVGSIDRVVAMAAFGTDGRFRKEFVQDINEYGDRDAAIYVVGSGEDERAAQLAFALALQAGFNEVYLLDGGIQAWMSQGLPVIK